MAYSDYGAFVTMDGERMEDREDVGVFDADEADLPSGARIYANLLKNMDGEPKRWEHSHHGVMGSGSIRCACYKTGLPAVWEWPDGADEPHMVWKTVDDMVKSIGPGGADWSMRFTADWLEEGLHEYEPYLYSGSEYDFNLEHNGYRFRFEHKKVKGSVHDGCVVYPREGEFMPYKATMTEPDGTVWECEYDYVFGAGWTEYGERTKRLDGRPANKAANVVCNSIMRKVRELFGESLSGEDVAELRDFLEGAKMDDIEFERRDDNLGQLFGMLKALLLMGYDMTWFVDEIESRKEGKDADVR